MRALVVVPNIARLFEPSVEEQARELAAVQAALSGKAPTAPKSMRGQKMDSSFLSGTLPFVRDARGRLVEM